MKFDLTAPSFRPASIAKVRRLIRTRLLLWAGAVTLCLLTGWLFHRILRAESRTESQKSSGSNALRITEEIAQIASLSAPKSAENFASNISLSELLAASLLSRSTSRDEVETNCPMFEEFHRLDFLHPALECRLCRDAVAYKVYGDGYPLCVLQHPFNQEMLDIVRQGSDMVELFDMHYTGISIFVYRANEPISNTIRHSGAWKPALVHWTLRFAQKLPDVTFLDVGSNVGVYSIQAAKLGLPVVSLDANIRNLLRLRLSLNAASLDAALVWNFIAPDQSLKYLSFLADCNVGGAGRDKADLPDTVPVMPLRSERLRELIKTKNVVMKMDIQGGEADFLQMSGRLFTDLNVAAVQTKWYRPRNHESHSIMIKFFTSRGYRAFSVPQFTAVHADDWVATDVIWVREDLDEVIWSLKLEAIILPFTRRVHYFLGTFRFVSQLHVNVSLLFLMLALLGAIGLRYRDHHTHTN